MFWLVTLFAVGGTYVAVDRALGSPIVIAIIVGLLLGYIVSIPFQGVIWFNEKTGIDAFINSSWQSLSGAESPSEVAKDCPDEETDYQNYSLMGDFVLPIVILLTGIAVLLINLPIALIAIVGIPLGLISTILTGLYTIATARTQQDTDWLRKSLSILLAGLGAVIIVGLSLRLVGAMHSWTC